MPLRALRAAQSGARIPDEVLTIKEVAAPLKLTEKTAYANDAGRRDSGFPGTGAVAHQARTELDQWIDAQPRGGEGGRDGDA